MSKNKIASVLSSYRFSTISIAAALAAIAFGYYRSATTDEIGVKIDEQRSALGNLKLNITSAQKITDHIAILDQNLEKIKPRIAQGENYALNLQYFYKLEAESGVKITNISKSDDSKGAKTQKIGTAFNISVEGAYHNTLKFMALAEKFLYFGRINNYTLSLISKTEKEEFQDLVSCTINIELYTGQSVK